jgi:hypothetical protein
VLLFFSVARSQDNASWERATEEASNVVAKPAAKNSKTATNANFGTNMPMMSSAFDTSMWLGTA